MKPFCVCFLLFVLAASAWAQIAFEDPVNLSETFPNFNSFVMRTDEENIYLVRQALVEGRLRVYFTRSKDGGNTFEEPRDIVMPPLFKAGGGDFSFLVEDHVLHIAVRRSFESISYCRSEDQGESFKCRGLGDGSRGSRLEGLQLAASGRNVYIAWHNAEGPLLYRVYLVVSRDAGRTFAPVITVSDPEVNSVSPRLQTAGDVVYITWTAGQQTFIMRGYPVE